MLDTCSTGSFVLEDIADSPGIKGADTRLMGKTMNGRQFQYTKIQNGLVFSDLRGENGVQLLKVFTSEDLSLRDLFSHKVVHNYKHLKSTADDLPPQIPDAKIGPFIAQAHSKEDKKFLKIVSQGARHTDDSHYEIPLPFRSKAPLFPENRKQALQENIVELLAQVSDRYPILSGHYFPATWTTSLWRI